MAEIKNPKRYYYAMRNRYARATKQIGHKLALALTEEEDAALWEKYRKVLEQWRTLENPEGTNRREEFMLRQRRFWKPVFNEDYVALTEMLVNLYGKRSGMEPSRERNSIDAEIERVKEKRKTVTVYIDRETGEEMRWQ